MRRSNVVTASVSVCLPFLLFTGCGGGDSDPSGPGEPEDRGTQLALFTDPLIVSYWGELAWTRDGEALVLLHDGIQKVEVATRAITVLDASPSITTLARGNAAERFYFGAYVDRPLGQANFEINRVHPTTTANETLFHVFPSHFDVIAVSPDERYLVIGGRLYDLASGTYIDLPGGAPYGFSPDGSRIFYSLNAAGTSPIGLPVLIGTADGSSQPLHGTGDHYLLHRWEGNTPHLLKAQRNIGTQMLALTEINGLTGAERQIAEVTTTDNFLSAGEAAWSPDGQTLAVWIEQGDRSKLYLFRSGAPPTIAANVRSGAVPGAPVFSPDGASIAYLLRGNGRLYLYLK